MKYSDFHQRSILDPHAFWDNEATRIDWKAP